MFTATLSPRLICVALCGLAGTLPAFSADRLVSSREVSPNAVVGGGRVVSTEQARQASRAIDAPPATTVFHSRLPDGSLELSDRPPARGATPLGQRAYVLPSESVSARRAQAEREYWSRQNEAFERRQRDRARLAAAEEERRESARQAPVVVIDGRQSGWYAPSRLPNHPRPPVPVPLPAPVDYGLGPQPAPLPGPYGSNGGSAYVSSPGAVQGRPTGGFIGSGFATGR